MHQLLQMYVQMYAFCYGNAEVGPLQVIGQLSGRYSIPAIKQAIEWLSGEGFLYTTVNDTSFKSTTA